MDIQREAVSRYLLRASIMILGTEDSHHIHPIAVITIRAVIILPVMDTLCPHRPCHSILTDPHHQVTDIRINTLHHRPVPDRSHTQRRQVMYNGHITRCHLKNILIIPNITILITSTNHLQAPTIIGQVQASTQTMVIGPMRENIEVIIVNLLDMVHLRDCMNTSDLEKRISVNRHLYEHTLHQR